MILFDGVQAPHCNYVGDYILGYKAPLGTESISSIVKSDRTLVIIRSGAEQIETVWKKTGVLLGVFTEIGCNSVNPGSVIGRHTNLYSTSCVRGWPRWRASIKTAGVIASKKQEER